MGSAWWILCRSVGRHRGRYPAVWKQSHHKILDHRYRGRRYIRLPPCATSRQVFETRWAPQGKGGKSSDVADLDSRANGSAGEEEREDEASPEPALNGDGDRHHLRGGHHQVVPVNEWERDRSASVGGRPMTRELRPLYVVSASRCTLKVYSK